MTPLLELGTPATLFADPERASWGTFAVSADGRRFLSPSADRRGAEQPHGRPQLASRARSARKSMNIGTVVRPWPAELARR
jgi:hypothetical protein